MSVPSSPTHTLVITGTDLACLTATLLNFLECRNPWEKMASASMQRAVSTADLAPLHLTGPSTVFYGINVQFMLHLLTTHKGEPPWNSIGFNKAKKKSLPAPAPNAAPCLRAAQAMQAEGCSPVTCRQGEDRPPWQENRCHGLLQK